MKNLILLLPILLSSNILAQTIDANWMFSIGDSSISKRMQQIGEVYDPGPEGIDVTWDFSTIEIDATLINYSVDYNDAQNFGINSFSPNTNFATYDSGVSPRIRYYDLANNDLLYYGDSVLNGSKIVYDIPVLQFSFPMEFNEEINTATSYVWYDNMGNFGFANTSEISRKIDGIGTLITPQDTFYNCIRVKEERIDQAQSPTPLPYTTYTWYDQKLSNEVARIYIDDFFTASNFSWQTNLNQTLTTTKNLLEEKPLVQYLKNNEFLIQQVDGLFAISIFDLSGKKIEEQSLRLNQGGSHLKLDQFYPAPNIFFILFVNTKTNDFFVHKFMP